MALSEWNNYDYNGVIFVFGRINSSVTPYWADVYKVMMSVDSSSNFVYSAEIKDIPYFQTTNIDGSTCDNNVSCKVFNINTYTHRLSDTTAYQFSSGTHTCYLRFYYTSTNYVTASVSVQVHCSLTTPTLTIDGDSGIVTVNRSVTSNSPRYYIEIRRKDRNTVNPSISWQDKDYIHTVVMKGIEGGKYNEGIPHTALMVRGTGNISSSEHRVSDKADLSEKETDEYGIALMSNVASEPTTIYLNTDVEITSGERYHYFKFTATAAGTYHFYQSSGVDLACYLYSDSSYSNYITGDDDSGGDYAFSVTYTMTAGQTVYIKIYDYHRNGATITIGVEKLTAVSVSSWTAYEVQGGKSALLSYYSSGSGYVTLYPAKKATGLRCPTATVNCYSGKTPYYVFAINSGTNSITVTNTSSNSIKFWLTNTHSDTDFQPHWRVNPITKFNACVVFDNAEIEEEYGEICIAQVNDALTLLAGIISETSGTSVTFNITNKGVSKLYVDETLEADSYSGRYVNSSNKITSSSSQTLYYAKVSAGTIYRVSYNHGTLYYATSIATSTYTTTVSSSSSLIWYENVGYDVGIDENTLIVGDNTSSYYVISNSAFTLEKILGVSDCSQDYHDEYSYSGYNVTVRFGLDGTTWMGNQGIATSGQLKNGGCSADINGQGQWLNWLYYDSSWGVQWSYAIINIDTSDLFETLYHVIHEEIAQSLGIGDDCYSHEESIHWDPEYANPDYYTGVDRTILEFAYANDLNGYTQFDLCNDFDLPITLYREYSERTSSNTFQFRLKDADGNWLLRSGEYEIYAWCTTMGTNGGSIAGSGNDGWDDDPYSLRSSPVTFTVQNGWYWSDYGIDMKSGLNISNVPYSIWNAFVDAVIEVMGSGTLPDSTTDYGTAAGMSFADGIQKAKTSEGDKTLYAQRFNIVNYIINSAVTTGIGVQKSLSNQVMAEYMIKLQDCRNLM